MRSRLPNTRRGFIEIHDYDFGAIFSEGDGRGSTDPSLGCSTSDDGNFTLKQHEEYL
ncbi:hypothetical protein PSNVIR_04486 [Pseudomonas sp. Nvir]|jgi:hypothetical protein|nr:hypothetical protein PSNVIR_04486 [Pseudomonas sp. Nvir]SUD79054.1 Uncharacterised protein [Pseudomonas putida]